MNKKLLSLIFLFMGVISLLNAQETSRITVKGVVIDETTMEPIAFANLGLLGTITGTASDIDGKFELTVPDKYSTYTIRVSAVGYSSYETKVYEAAENPNLTIILKPVTYGIGEVEVFAESLVYKQMLKKVVENISKNYIAKPYNYTGYFKYELTSNAMPLSMKESIVTIYDKKGYNRSNTETAFKELNYKFTQVRRDKPAKSVLDGITYFDDILTADIIRNPRNVLDLDNARDYQLKNKGKLLYEGDSVRVIGYEVKKPELSTSGDAGVTKYSGEIFVNMKDYSVLKNVINITSNSFNILGRNLIPVGEDPKQEVKMTIITNYKKLNSVYFLSGITIKYTYKENGNNIEGEMQYVTTRVNMTTPDVITGRSYYEEIPANPKYWNNYSVYFEGEE